MKKIYSIFVILSAFNLVAQKDQPNGTSFEVEEPITHTETNAIWGTINGDGPNSNPALDSLIDINGLIVSQPLKDSKNPKLKSLYEFKYDCDITELIEDLRCVGVENIELVSTPSPLGSETNDYNKVFSTDYALDLINAKGAWDVNKGNRKTKIGISDSNFDINHEELIDKFSYRQASNNTNYNHGTAVAITAAGNTNNGLGKSSIGYDCDLMLYPMSYNSILQAAYAGVDVINVSWASGCNYNIYQQEAINEALENGIIIIAAAGNGTTCGGASNLVYPAAYEGVIAVSSIGADDKHEKIPGNPNSTHQHNESVDIVAPGYNVPLAFSNNTYGTSSGTSYATPLVTGTVGLMLSEEPNLSLCEVDYILKKTAVNIDSLNPNYQGMLGEGRLDAAEALKMTQDFALFGLRHEVTKMEDEVLLNIEGDGCMEIQGLNYEFEKYIYLGTGVEARVYSVTYTSIYGCETKAEYIIEEDDFNVFEDTSLVILPVELIDFSAKPVKDKIEVDWITGSELNNSHFITEKTYDGRFWYGLTITQGQGTTSSQTEYQELDFNPKVGVQYYRLIQVDYNGDKTFYYPISVNYGRTGNMLTAYPNPSDDEITIKWTNTADQILIYDQAGELVKKYKPSELDSKLVLSGYDPGMYIINAFIDGEKLILKFIIV